MTSPTSAALAIRYGAVGSAPYTAPPLTCIDTVRSLGDGVPIRHALDCITSAESVAICSGALARTGGRYVCLEWLDKSWQTRKAVKSREVMGFEGLGIHVDLGPASGYTREASESAFAICTEWASEMQVILDNGAVEPHPIREVKGKWDGILQGLDILQKGGVRGEKVVVSLKE